MGQKAGKLEIEKRKEDEAESSKLQGESKKHGK
jgi:hypothetical protein